MSPASQIDTKHFLLFGWFIIESLSLPTTTAFRTTLEFDLNVTWMWFSTAERDRPGSSSNRLNMWFYFWLRDRSPLCTLVLFFSFFFFLPGTDLKEYKLNVLQCPLLSCSPPFNNPLMQYFNKARHWTACAFQKDTILVYRILYMHHTGISTECSNKLKTNLILDPICLLSAWRMYVTGCVYSHVFQVSYIPCVYRTLKWASYQTPPFTGL